jgi:hypothetical protein
MVLLGGSVNWRLSTAIVVTSDAFAEYIGLNLAIVGRAEVASTPFPVNLIKTVWHQDSTSNDTSPSGRFDGDLNFAEKEIEAAPDVWSIEALSEGELRTITTILHHSLVCESPVLGVAGLLSKIDGIISCC